MKKNELIEFIQNKMRMSHIYQPLLIKILLEAGGKATIRHLANEFIKSDESQIRYYQNIIKNMPIKVLKSHNVVNQDKDTIELNLNLQKLTLNDKADIKQICDQKIQEYISKRGLGIWDYRMLDKPISDVLRLRVYEKLKENVLYVE